MTPRQRKRARKFARKKITRWRAVMASMPVTTFEAFQTHREAVFAAIMREDFNAKVRAAQASDIVLVVSYVAPGADGSAPFTCVTAPEDFDGQPLKPDPLHPLDPETWEREHPKDWLRWLRPLPGLREALKTRGQN